MKKVLLFTVAIALVAAGSSFAAGGNTGCGLGVEIFKPTPQSSTLIQILAVTTNGTLGNQTFGITSGTSQCEQPKNFVRNDRLNEFVHANMDELARDIAEGKGETLDTVAELMSVPVSERAAFNRNLQAHFSEIFPSPGVEYAQVVDSIIRVSNQG